VTDDEERAVSSQPEENAGSAAAAEEPELQGYGNDTGFAEEAEQADEDGKDAAAPAV
jgi:hypothetical protein